MERRCSPGLQAGSYFEYESDPG